MTTVSLLTACVDLTGPPFPRIEETEFDPSLGVDLAEMAAIQGGIYVLDLSQGREPPSRSARSWR